MGSIVYASEGKSVSAEPRGRLPLLFLVEGLASVGANLLTLGIFFYMQKQFGWAARRNLMLASAQGLFYICGALAANRISTKIGRRQMLRFLHATMGLSVLVAWMFPRADVICVVLLLYMMFSGAQWPALESLVSTNAKDERLARLLSIYNLTWSGTGALTIAVSGTLIVHFPRGIFVAAMIVHGLALSMFFLPPLLRNLPKQSADEISHAAPEPELLKMRTLAMQLSRIALPGTYAVVYGLGAMMPSLAVITAFSPAVRTLVASVWMIARWLAFLLCGATVWWHTRPRILLVATIVMMLAFLGVAIRASSIFPAMGLGQLTDGTTMIVAQIFLGLALGMIYSGSLYFGMVLSEGSTEHGGYHEALIGLGSVLGPGAGAMAQYSFSDPQKSQSASIAAVSFVILISVTASAWVSARRRG